MQATFNFGMNIPQNNRTLFLTVLQRMTEAFSRYYTQEFIDLVVSYVHSYAVDWWIQAQMDGVTEWPGYDHLPQDVWNRAFDAAYEEYDGELFDAEDGE